MVSKKQEETHDSDEEGEEEEDDVELLQIDVGDMIKVKQLLDEGVVAALLEELPEYYHWDNVKMTIMVVACGFAMMAQFAPLPFPESRWVLGVCCAGYFLFNTILQLITLFIDKDTILLTKPRKEAPPPVSSEEQSDKKKTKKKNPLLDERGLVIRSQFPRFSEFYTLILEVQQPDTEQEKDVKRVTQTWSIGQFFDKEGYFDEEGLQLQVQSLLGRLEDAQYDKDTTTKKNQ